MTCRRFFSDLPVANNRISVIDEELFHLKTVNRAREGDEIEIINGKGMLYRGRILALANHEAIVDITDTEREYKKPVKVVIAPSLTKKRAMNLMLEKVTEIGVDEIRPVIFSRTDAKYTPAMLKRWERIANQSLKVNKKLFKTKIFPPVSLTKLIDNTKTAKTKILLHINGKKGLPGDLFPPVVSVIGPPGGFISEEREFLLKTGFVPYRINDCIMKSETAAISIAAILKNN